MITLLAFLVFWMPGLLDPAAAQENNPVDFEADSVTVSNEEGTLIATGQVKVTQNGEILTADKVIYNKTSMTARAIGNVQILTLDGTVHSADEMTLDENFTHAIATPLLTKLADGSRFSAASGDHRQSKRTVFDRSVFSPCKCDYDKGESPIWDLRAEKSTHNTQTQTITHENVTMQIFGLPVFYTPVLAHPDATVERQSGFLTPNVTYSNDRGMTLTTPYYHVISPTQDIEFQPTNFQFRGQGLKTNYRQKWNHSDIDATIYTGGLETFKKRREKVAAIDTRFHTEIGQDWDIDMRLYRTSQDTFLRRYRYLSEDRLDSYIQAEKVSGNRYYQVRASDMQGLKPDDTEDKEPLILPSVFYEKVSQGPYKNQQIFQQFSALQLDNDEGYELVRWTGQLGTSYKWTNGGHVMTGSAELLGTYHDIQRSPNATEELNNLGQAQTIVTGEWKYPLGMRYGKNHQASAIIAPKIKVIAIEGSDRTDEVPNRDAADFRLDEANLFLSNRFQGRDFIVPGTQIASGISLFSEHPSLGDISGFAGMSYKASGQSPADLTSESRERYSDYVTSFALHTPQNVNLSWSARADHNTLELNESRTAASYSNNITSVAVTHTQIAQSYFTTNTDDREEATINFNQKLGGGLSFNAEQVWNLSDGQSKRDQFLMSLGWAGGFQDCLSISLDYKRDPYADRDIKKVSELQLQLNFKYLGSISQN